ncbi:ATP synthase gamma chain [Formosimonas limnophila]|uniref:ATP synthase gamma chain n=1 Tax=Formosimonas limnophila TaxID=1384487 RepID=A0A8J3FYC8_9BURK|nr:F0F1 ATP synthase subunit gamma [Formosimonas limnophila]GHA72083.1 ATP synthase gamma chain [Formosimonas limnophila]
MASMKEIRGKIKSVQNTRKITKAMEMVAASKMRKAQERMRAARPYADKVRNIAAHMSEANPEYKPPFLTKREEVKGAGLILISTDKGLCGGMNTNIIRASTAQMKKWTDSGVTVQTTAIGSKGLGFLNRINARVVSHNTHVGDAPRIDDLIGSIKVQLDAYMAGEIDVLYLGYTKFINSIKQEPTLVQLLPLTQDSMSQSDDEKKAYSWDYVYEPSAEAVVDELLVRYVEALVYQAVAENIASEQSARMVAMKAASDNAKNVIGELQLVYNKSRQAAITKELSEIVGGAAAV